MNILTTCLEAGLGPVLATAPSNGASDLLAIKFFYHVQSLGPKYRGLLDRAVRYTSTVELTSQLRPRQEKPLGNESDSEDEAPPDSNQEKREISELDLLLELEETIGRVPRELTMNYKRQQLDPTWDQQLDKYLNKEMDQGEQDAFHRLRDKLDNMILSKIDIVFTTCSSAGSHELSKYPATVVLVDEAGQGSEPETLIPLTTCYLSMKIAIFIGGHLQLPPFNINKIAILKVSMIHRLVKLHEKGISGVKVATLRNNYRSIAPIVHYTSAQFYSNRLIPTITERALFWDKLWAASFGTTASIVWVNCDGLDKRLPTNSVQNYENAETIVRILKLLEKNSTTLGYQLEKHHVGVVTMYKGQTETVEQLVEGQIGEGLEGLTISNVDSFQGRERPIIIVDLVRSNTSRAIGFLRKEGRINVAFSRAQYKTIVIGDVGMYAMSPLFDSVPCPSLFNLASEAKTGRIKCEGVVPHCHHDIKLIESASL
ncbi:hypothetical protein TWF281_004471 [Arthrobotrys megalospora]